MPCTVSDTAYIYSLILSTTWGPVLLFLFTDEETEAQSSLKVIKLVCGGAGASVRTFEIVFGEGVGIHGDCHYSPLCITKC